MNLNKISILEVIKRLPRPVFKGILGVNGKVMAKEYQFTMVTHRTHNPTAEDRKRKHQANSLLENIWKEL